MTESPREPPKPPPVRIALLGAPRISLDGQVAPLRPGKKALALLAYLAGHPGQELAREKLAALLWPDRFDEQARASLRQALTGLRKVLRQHGEAIRGTSDAVELDADVVTSDVAELDRLRRSERLEDLTAAAALYRGAFLETLGGVSEELDAWADQERRRLRAQAVELLERLVARHDAAGRLEEARAAAERLVAVDPGHEPGHRALMSAYAALGQRAAALRQYEACRRALAQLLDAEPDAETVALADAIRNAAADAPDRPSAETAPRPSPPAGPTGARAARRFPLLRLARRRRLVIGASLAALLAALLWVVRPPPASSPPLAAAPPPAPERSCLARAGATTGEPALIVLPLRTFGEDDRLAFFAAAATERVQSLLTLIPGVAVIAGPPAGHPDLELTAQEIAAKTGSTHVLDGAVRATPERIQVSLRLIDAASGRQLWQSTARFAAPLSDPVRSQDEIALEAANGVQEHLTDGRQALVYPRYEPASLEVWESNTRGWAYLARLDPVANERARAAFEASLALDPGNAGASTGLAFTDLSPVLFRWTTDTAARVAAARRRTEAALAVDPDFPSALSALSIVALLEGDHAAAVELGEQAMRRSGGGGDATAFLAFVLSYTEDTAHSVELAQRAIRSRPYASPLWYEWNLARALRLDGDLEAAVACLSAINAAFPTAAAPALELILAYDAAGEPERARALADLVRAQTADAFSSARYCALPPYADDATTAACVASLTAAGLPQ